MARIAGVNIPQNKLVQVGLTYIMGAWAIHFNHERIILERFRVSGAIYGGH